MRAAEWARWVLANALGGFLGAAVGGALGAVTFGVLATVAIRGVILALVTRDC